MQPTDQSSLITSFCTFRLHRPKAMLQIEVLWGISHAQLVDLLIYANCLIP